MRYSAIPCGIALAVFSSLLCNAAAFSPEGVLESDPYAARKVFYEDHWQKKIERALAYVPGVIVSVNVELSQEVKKTVTSESLNGTPATTLEEESSSSRAEGMDPNPSQLVSQGPNREANRTGERVSHTSVSTKSIVPMSESVTVYTGLVPEKVRVSIVAPSRALEAFDGRAEKLKLGIEQVVEPLLPEAAGIDSYQRVRVVILSPVNEKTPAPPTPLRAASRELRVNDLISVTLGKLPEMSGPSALNDPMPRSIPVKVVEIHDNGTLVIQGQKVTVAGDKTLVTELSGEAPADAIQPDRSVLSSRIAKFKLERRFGPDKR